MFEEDLPLLRELSLIFLLSCALLFIPGRAFFSLLPLIPLAFFAGLVWSLLNKKDLRLADIIITNLGAIGILVWFVFALSHSYFGYKEVLMILIKSTIFLAAVFCFCAANERYRTYILFLSVLICVGAILYSQRTLVLSGISLLVVFFCWLVLMKLRFLQFFGFKKANTQQWGRSLMIPGIVCAAVMVCGTFVFSVISTPYLKKMGFFDSPDLTDTGELESLEKEYYSAQDAFQTKASQFALNSPENFDRRGMMKLASLTVKDNSEVQEVAKADQGLKSLLHTPGPGDEKGEGSDVTHALGKYTELKSTINVVRQSDKMIQQIRDQNATFFQAVSMLISLGSMRFSSTHKDIASAGRRIDAKIEKLNISPDKKEDLKEQAADLKAWRIYGSFLKQIRLLKAQLNSASAGIRRDFNNAVSQIENIQGTEDIRQALKEISRLKQEHPKNKNYSRRLDEIMALRMEMVLAIKEEELINQLGSSGAPEETIERVKKKLEDLRKEDSRNEESVASKTNELSQEVKKAAEQTAIPEDTENKLLNEIEGIKKILMTEVKKEEVQAKREEEEKAAKLQEKKVLRWKTFSWLFWIIILLLLCVSLVYFFYRLFVTWRERARLLAAYANPRLFIVNLYGNLRRIIVIFGMRQKDELPPLYQAVYLGNEYGICVQNIIFFSEKFEEAWYSGHKMLPVDAANSLDAYNKFLDIIWCKANPITRFNRIFLSILSGVPLKINLRPTS